MFLSLQHQLTGLAIATACIASQSMAATNQQTKPLPESFNVPNTTAQQEKSIGKASAMDALMSSDTTQAERSVLDEVKDILGKGYNSVSQSLGGNCVSGIVSGLRPSSFNTVYSMQQIESSAQLHKEMSAEASASGGFAGWTAKASTAMDKSSSNDVETKFLLVRIKSIATPNVILHEAHLAGVKAGDPDALKAPQFVKCGDQYVSKVVMGGELVALLSYQKTSDEQESSLLAALSVSGPSMSADASFKQKATQLQNDMHVKVDYVKVGGIDEVPDMTIAGLLSFAADFGRKMSGSNAAFIGIETSPYTDLGVEQPDLTDTIDTANTLRDNLVARSNYLLALTTAQTLRSKYGVPDNNELAPRISQMSKEIKAINSAIAKCAMKISASCSPDPNLLTFAQPVVHRPRNFPIEIANSNNSISQVFNQPGWKLMLVGRACLAGPTGLCMANGFDDATHAAPVQVSINNRVEGYRHPIDIPFGGQPTNVTIHLVDQPDYYGDNVGDLRAVFY